MPKKEPKIVITKDGPYAVSGNVPLDKQIILTDSEGEPVKWGQREKYPSKESYHLCRCGQSKEKPFCDGSHEGNFDGTEKASRKTYNEQAETIEGPDLILKDAECFCAFARFCHRMGGTWDLTRDSANPKSKTLAIQQACDCSAGRLVAIDKKTKKPIEPDFKPSISLTEDPSRKVSGPLWVKGGVEIESSDGKNYEKRNRVTLCRCGKSKNKPFCDGEHLLNHFSDGDKSLI